MLKFNIIYTTDTVKYLLPFAKSVLQHNSVNIRLISNNCNQTEIEILKKEAHKTDRISFFKVETNTVLPHHQVLNQLYKLDEDEYFAFMDSDIFCNGHFVTTFSNSLETNSAVFSCKPISISPQTPEINKIQGRHFHDKNNKLIGGSYFAIYKRNDIDTVHKKLGFLFDRKNWIDLNPEMQSKLKQGDMVYEKYDTAKLLNFFLRENAFTLDYTEHQNLFHIGGLSWNKTFIQNKNIKPIFPDNNLGKVLKKRNDIAEYFSEYIDSCLEGRIHPEIPQVSEQENAKILKITAELNTLYQ